LIVAQQKPIEEIFRSLEGFQNILIAACGTCVTVCMAGGEKEAMELAALLDVKNKEAGKSVNIKVVTLKRQCDMEFFDDIVDDVNNAEVILSMACGAGVQFIAERFSNKPVLPGLNTKFMGVTRDVGLWTEMCQGCGNCILEKTGGVCPVTRCSKSIFNGPCGGSSGGKCEVNSEIDCGWQLIYDRLKALGRLDKLYEITEVRDWRSSRDGGPRKVEKKDMMV